MIVLAVIALVVVGPEKLPSMARKIGSFLNDLKRTTNTLTAEINSTMDEESFQKDRVDGLKDQKPENKFETAENGEHENGD